MGTTPIRRTPHRTACDPATCTACVRRERTPRRPTAPARRSRPPHSSARTVGTWVIRSLATIPTGGIWTDATSMTVLIDDRVDILFLHQQDPLTPLEESMRALEDLATGGSCEKHGDEGGEQCGGDPPVAGAVDRCGKAVRQEAGGVSPGGAACARHGTARPCHQLGEAAGQLRVRGAGLDQREVCGRALVEDDQFVDLGAGESALAAQQGVQTVPFGPVCGHEDVEVHRLAAPRLLVLRLSWCGAIDSQLGRLAVPGAAMGRAAGVSELVTGEAVALELRPAKLPSRALAVLIDMVVAWSAYLAVTLGLLAAAGSLDDAAVAAIAVATFVLVLVGVPIAVETLSHGRSLGKLACGLRVVRDDGGPIRFRHALVRALVGVIELWLTFGGVAAIVTTRGPHECERTQDGHEAKQFASLHPFPLLRQHCR